jgi:hypothetical protein
VSRRTMARMAALASSFVASTPSVLPSIKPSADQNVQRPPEDFLMHFHIQPLADAGERRMIRCVLSRAKPRNCRSDKEYAQRQAIPRSESIPSKYPIKSMRKYTPGGNEGRPFSA